MTFQSVILNPEGMKDLKVDQVLSRYRLLLHTLPWMVHFG